MREVHATLAVLLLATQLLSPGTVAAEETTSNAAMIERMELLIKNQQQQLDSMQQQLNQLKATTKESLSEAKREAKESLSEAKDAKREAKESLSEAKDAKREAEESLSEAKDAKREAEAAKAALHAPAPPDLLITRHEGVAKVREPAQRVVTSGGADRAKLVVSGFVNRMVMGVDDGHDTEYYNADNDNAESRVSFLGTLNATDDLTLGTRIELTIAPNKSGNLNQLNQEENNIFDQRWVEMHLDSKRYGRLSLGKGDTASFNTGASDLSGTVAIAYATIADTAGGMLFREKNGGAFTDVNIVQVFNNWDGLNRLSRLRYDTPRFNGFSFATSLASDSRHDAAVRWGGQGYGFKAVASAAIADPNVKGYDLNYTGSFSALHQDSGINLTFSAGTRERHGGGDPYSLYGKLGWRKNLYAIGETAFGIDYAYTQNAPTDDDEGYSYGLSGVQQFKKYGTEAYALYRHHSLDRGVEPDVDDIGVVVLGARVRF